MLVVAAVSVSGCASRHESGPLQVTGRLGDRKLASASADSPIELRPDQVTTLELTLTNVGDEPVTVGHVRLEGELLDLIFLTYDTGVHTSIAPGQEKLVRFDIDFFDLNGQAHGLLRGKVSLYGDDREPLGAVPVVLDGRGGPWATMVTFNLVLLAVAVASFGWNLYRLGQRLLPAHRFARGLRFLHSGAAAGLTVSAASSTLRIWPLGTTGWVSITVVMALFAFAIGYLGPGSDEADAGAPAGHQPHDGEVIDLVSGSVAPPARPVAPAAVPAPDFVPADVGPTIVPRPEGPALLPAGPVIVPAAGPEPSVRLEGEPAAAVAPVFVGDES
ncbi:MAG: hypothetical protein R2761_15125 [Acidimicrobiales bacterium]